MTRNPVSAYEALRLLKEGNVRFVEGRTESPNRDYERRKLTSEEGQVPFAAVLACSDSRAPISTLFDRGVGDIFTIRLAGNVVGEIGTGSIEYAVEHLDIPLLVILGHSRCGAVQAALDEGSHSVCINKLIEKIAPAVRKTLEHNKDLTGRELADEVALTNVWLKVEDLHNNEIVRSAVEAGRLVVMAAFYDLDAGRVEWMSDINSEKSQRNLSMNRYENTSEGYS